MFYDTLYRHNQALIPDPDATIGAALNGLLSAIDDCRRAGKSIEQDAAILLLIRALAGSAARAAPDVAALAARCAADRAAILAHPALLAIAGHRVGGDRIAKRTFHAQARQALARVTEALGLAPEECKIVVTAGGDHEDGMTELRQADFTVRVVPRGFLPDSEVTWFRCARGVIAGHPCHGKAALLLDPGAFARRLSALRPARTPLPVAA
jgi:hypothetical protein